MIDKCPVCDSPRPHLHPAVQHEGEVQFCSDPFHQHHDARVTPIQNAAGNVICYSIGPASTPEDGE